jgi:hypothetical protein
MLQGHRCLCSKADGELGTESAILQAQRQHGTLTSGCSSSCCRDPASDGGAVDRWLSVSPGSPRPSATTGTSAPPPIGTVPLGEL